MQGIHICQAIFLVAMYLVLLRNNRFNRFLPSAGVDDVRLQLREE
jgi:hypothetical protein